MPGRGTTHCTNGITVQRAVTNADEHQRRQPVSEEQDVRSHRLQRSFQVHSSASLPYSTGRRCGPAVENGESLDRLFGESKTSSSAEDLAFVTARLSSKYSRTLGRASETSQTVPGWSGFNAILNEDNVQRTPRAIIGYLPASNASPTKLATVSEVLKQCIDKDYRLHQNSAIITVDQGIYAKAKEIAWKNPTDHKRIVLRMKTFDICITYIADIGKKFADSGLKDLIIESGLAGPSAVNGKRS